MYHIIDKKYLENLAVFRLKDEASAMIQKYKLDDNSDIVIVHLGFNVLDEFSVDYVHKIMSDHGYSNSDMQYAMLDLFRFMLLNNVIKIKYGDFDLSIIKKIKGRKPPIVLKIQSFIDDYFSISANEFIEDNESDLAERLLIRPYLKET